MVRRALKVSEVIAPDDTQVFGTTYTDGWQNNTVDVRKLCIGIYINLIPIPWRRTSHPCLKLTQLCTIILTLARIFLDSENFYLLLYGANFVGMNQCLLQ